MEKEDCDLGSTKRINGKLIGDHKKVLVNYCLKSANIAQIQKRDS